MSGQVTVLGINGRIGQAAAKAFVAAGWDVVGFGRTDWAKIAGVSFHAGDASDVVAIKAACAGSEVVMNALNLAYDKWGKGRAEAQLAGVLDALKGSGKTLLFPGNIYNYAEDQHLITPQTRQRPARDKGEIRVRMEKMLDAASGDGLQVIVLRAGDFYGPGASGTMFDLALLTELKKGVLQYPADPSIAHSWAYLPDLGRAYVALAEQRAEQPAFAAYLYRGHFETGAALLAQVKREVSRPVRVKRLSWGLLRVLGLFVPMLRELVKMSYLWRQPHQMRDPRLDALLGDGFGTPFDEAVRETVRSYLPAGAGDTEQPVATAPSRP